MTTEESNARTDELLTSLIAHRAQILTDRNVDAMRHYHRALMYEGREAFANLRAMMNNIMRQY